MIGWMRIEPPAARYLTQLDASIGFFELLLQCGERLRGLRCLDFEHTRERHRAHRFVGHEQQRLERCRQLLGLQSLKHPLPHFIMRSGTESLVLRSTFIVIEGQLSLPVIAYSALLSFLSVPIGQAMIFIREWLSWITDKLMPR